MLAFYAALWSAMSLNPSSRSTLPEKIEQIRAQHSLPALAAHSIRADLQTTVVTGYRKQGDPTLARENDPFHLGSCTKAMTATLLAIHIERGELKWESTMAELFPGLVVHPSYRDMTLETLTAQRGGVIGSETQFESGALWNELWNPDLDATEGRKLVARRVLSAPPAYAPGSRFEYSNFNYIIAGAVLERITGKSWEALMREELFAKLDMKSCGFGPAGNPATNPPDAPWGHLRFAEASPGPNPSPVPPSFGADNPPTVGPAGTVHCSIADWGKFARIHIDGFNGKITPILRPESFKKLHQSVAGQSYTAGGWIRVDRDWAGGPAFNHGGTNTMNYANIWLAPLKDTAFLSAANAGGTDAEDATDEAIVALIDAFETE